MIPICSIRWKLRVTDENDTIAILSPDQMHSFCQEKTRCVWRGADCLGDDFTVEAQYELEDNDTMLCSLRWTPSPKIEEVLFPIVTRPYHSATRFISGFWNLGTTFDFKPGFFEHIECTSMQFCAFLDADNGSVHIEHRDSLWYSKSQDISISEDGTSMEVASIFNVPFELDGSLCSQIPYKTAIHTFAGDDWMNSASFYRKWALRQPWANSAPKSKLPYTDMWVWNRGDVDEVRGPVLKLAAELKRQGLKMSFLWYWWHNNPYDTAYPDFWPPRDSIDKFDAFIAELREAGVFTMVYVNGVCWDMDFPGWAEGGDESAVIQRDKTQFFIPFNTYNHHRLGFVCGGAPKFADKLSTLIRTLRLHNLSGQYLDIIGCATNFRCWNPDHGHPMNGGHYTVDGYHTMLERLANENPDFPLTTECANEAYMDVTAGAFVCSGISAERFGIQYRPVPLFSAVYHDVYTQFGSYACADGIPPWDKLWPSEDRWKTEKPWHRLYPHMFFLEFARMILWGVEPMICNVRSSWFDDDDFATARNYTYSGLMFRKEFEPYLTRGIMEPLPELTCKSIDVTFFQRMIFTKENQCRELTIQHPAILHAAWSVSGKPMRIFMVNYTGESQAWHCLDKSGVMPPYAFFSFEC